MKRAVGLQITTRVRDNGGGHRIVAIAGQIDIVTSRALHAFLILHLHDVAETGGTAVTVDLSAVEFMDARGLTALLRADRRARALGIGLHLTALPATVTRLLAITGLDRHFTLTAGPAHAT